MKPITAACSALAIMIVIIVAKFVTDFDCDDANYLPAAFGVKSEWTAIHEEK